MADDTKPEADAPKVSPTEQASDVTEKAQPELNPDAKPDETTNTDAAKEAIATNGKEDSTKEANGEAEAAETFKPTEDVAVTDGSKKRKLDSDIDYRANKHKRENKRNVKSDPSTLKVTDDPVEIRKQVEFYFSDSNLPTDKHLSDMTGNSQNLPIPLAHIHKFSRMRRFQPYEAIVAALKESATLEVTEDEGVRRKVPLAEENFKEDINQSYKFLEDRTLDRSIYAKGFGEEIPSTQFDIEAFFTKYGTTNAVRLRRAPDRTFKSSVFVEFVDTETQKKFLDMEEKPKWKGGDLLIKSKRQYCEEKAVLYASRGGKSSRGRGGRGSHKSGMPDGHWRGKDRGRGSRGRYQGGRGGGGGRYHRDGRDHRDRAEERPERAPKLRITEDLDTSSNQQPKTTTTDKAEPAKTETTASKAEAASSKTDAAHASKPVEAGNA